MSPSDTNLFAAIKDKLFTSVIGDVMDAAGLTHQFLPPSIRALRADDMLVGRAMTVLEADCASDVATQEGSGEPFGLMFRALDSLKNGDVYICTGSSPRYALWGELMTTRAMELGAAGVVVDGYHRDTHGIMSLPLPVFSQGSYAQDQRVRGRVIDFNCPIEFPNATRVNPGDLIVGDVDGVLVVPSAHVDDIVKAALAKVEGEEQVRQMILAGRSTQSIFDETGIM